MLDFSAIEHTTVSFLGALRQFFFDKSWGCLDMDPRALGEAIDEDAMDKVDAILSAIETDVLDQPVEWGPSPGCGPVHLAAALGRLDILRRLLSAGANPNMLSRNRDASLRMTPLQLLCSLPSRHARQIAELLIIHGATVSHEFVTSTHDPHLSALFHELGF